MNQKVELGARVLLGLIFFVFGLNGAMMMITGNGFIPMPAPAPEMMTVMGGFFAATYLMPLVKLIEVVCGALLLWGKYTSLAIVLLCPIVVNILGVHLFVDLSGLPMAILVTVLTLIVLKSNWHNLSSILNK